MSDKISLCIPTLNRFDKFLSNYLDSYVEYLKEGIINEIVICDEDGNDYDKIKKKYESQIGENFKIFKNDTILGVFLNKRKVCELASYHNIALIDSDNFPSRKYFIAAKQFMKKNILGENYILSPIVCETTTFDFKNYSKEPITKETVKKYVNERMFLMLMNTGNYIMSGNIVKNLKCDIEEAKKAGPYDVIFYNVEAFRKLQDFKFFVVEGMTYKHMVHTGSEWMKTHSKSDRYYNGTILKNLKEL